MSQIIKVHFLGYFVFTILSKFTAKTDNIFEIYAQKYAIITKNIKIISRLLI